MTRALIADARGMTGDEFFHALFPKPNPDEAIEIAAAKTAYRNAVQDSYRLPTLDEEIARRAELKLWLAARLDEIAEKYALTEVEHLGPGRIAA